MAWLDAMRGFAALCVVFSHLSFHDLQSLRGPVYDVFDPGLYGVSSSSSSAAISCRVPWNVKAASGVSGSAASSGCSRCSW
jgi:peptidoglycan/LPS O-acetylase OafA/YrhL